MQNSTVKSSSISFLDRVFPPPSFLRMDAAGIDISDTAIRFISFGYKKGKRFIKAYGKKPLPIGAVSSGYINDPNAIIKILSDIKKETGISFMNVSLPEEKAYLFKMQVPKLPDAELYDAVGFRIEENVPISAKEAIYDFAILTGDKKDTSHYDVLVSVIPIKVAEAYSNVFKSAGITPLTFEIGSQAVSRSVVPRESKGSYLVVNLSDNKTGLAIVNQGIVFFTSTVPVGGEALDGVIAKTFNVPMRNVPEVKAEIMASGKQDMKLFLEVMDATLPIKEEVVKLATYWKTHSVGILHAPSSIDKIILCGKDTALPAVDEYIYAVTGIRAETANVWGNVFSFEDYIPSISYSESLDYGGAIGLAMIS